MKKNILVLALTRMHEGRIGKGRPWAQDAQEEKKIYNLVISILTIPDYARVRTYYDFEKMLGRQF